MRWMGGMIGLRRAGVVGVLLTVVGCSGPTPPSPAAVSATPAAFDAWVQWRAHECRFVGDLEAGTFVCTNHQTYPSTLMQDAKTQVPQGFVPTALTEGVARIQAHTVPQPYADAGEGRGFRSDRATGRSRYVSDAQAAMYPAYRWYQQWRAWRAEHCTLQGRLDRGAWFACDDGQTYPTRIARITYQVMPDEFQEPSQAPVDWLNRYHPAQYANALPEAQRLVLPSEGAHP